MGLFSFIKDAGSKLFGNKEAEAAAAAEQAATDEAVKAAAAANLKAANASAAAAIADHIRANGLNIASLSTDFDAVTGTVAVAGVAADQATREKALLCCGNVAGVSQVKDQMSVDQSAPEATYYDVKSGDTLSAISKHVYGDANKYNTIFEANKPMLSHPDKIYPGQKLRIPALG